jgi:HK97 family phage portal protein
MGLINRAVAAVWRLGDAFRPRAEGTSTITTSGDLERVLRRIGWAGGMSIAGVHVSLTSAQRLAAVASCERVIGRTLAHLPLVVYRQDGRSKLPAVDLPVYQLLHDRPNEHQTSYQFRRMLFRDQFYRGNAYAFKVRGVGGRLIELRRLHPDCTEPKLDPATQQIKYEYRRPGGGTMTFERDEILHLWEVSEDGVKGLNQIALHRETIGDGIALREHGSRFFSNGARPGGVLQTKEKLGGTEQIRELREDFESVYAGNENAHKVAILDQGLEYKAVGISMEDAQYIDARKFNRAEIAGLWGVPPHKIGDLDKATFSNIEHQGLEFVTDCIGPLAVCFEQSCNADLLGNDPGLYVKLNLNALLRGDFKTRQEGLLAQRRAGVISANEWRELEDFNPRADKGGDQYIVEENMTDQTGGLPPKVAKSPAASPPPPAN